VTRHGFTAVVLSAALSITALLVATPPATASSPVSLMFDRNGDETFAQAIVRNASIDSAFRAEVLGVLGSWETSTPAAGTLPGTDLTQVQLSALAVDLPSVASNGSATNAVASLPVSTTTATAVSASVVPSVAVSNDPNSFPVRGSAQGDRSYWSGNPMLQKDLVFCGSSSCTTTDSVKAKLVITPTRARTVSGGSLGSSVAWTIFYFPNAGNFTNVHMDTWGITSSRIMYLSSPGSSGDYSAARPSGKFYAKNDTDLSSKRLTVAVELWANAVPLGGYVFDGGKTADCIGRTGLDVRCFY
jgi:hypothetical protein